MVKITFVLSDVQPNFRRQSIHEPLLFFFLFFFSEGLYIFFFRSKSLSVKTFLM